MFGLLKEKLVEVIKTVTPLVTAVCILQLTIVGAPTELFVQFLIGSVMAAVGMLLFFAGVDLGILPMGRFIGAYMPTRQSVTLLLTVAFALGFATTFAEPDVLVLASQVEAISGGEVDRRALMYAISGGVGLFVAIGLLRIVAGFPMTHLLTITYGVIVALTLFAATDAIPLAYDAGSVTTGALTTPVVLALAIGLSSVLANRSAAADGFGLLGLASAGPIVVLLFWALFQ
jgi:hypothetical protein